MRWPGVLLLLLALFVAACVPPTAASPMSTTSPLTAVTTVSAPTATPSSGPASPTSHPTTMNTSVGSSATPSSRSTSSPTGLAGARIITRADQGQTLRLAVGDALILRLGNDTLWDIQVTDPRVLVPDRTATPGPDEQGVYRARQAGVTEILAVALPACAKSQPPCQVIAPALRFLIVVS